MLGNYPDVYSRYSEFKLPGHFTSLPSEWVKRVLSVLNLSNSAKEQGSFSIVKLT